MFKLYAYHNYVYEDTLVWARDGEVINSIVVHMGSYGDGNTVVFTQSANTNPTSFLYSYDMWWDLDDTTNSGPDWDLLAALYGGIGAPQHDNELTDNPLFVDSTPDTTYDFMLQSGSPAVGAGSTYVNIVYDWWNEEYIDGTDYSGTAWAATPSLGAFEGAASYAVSPSPASAAATGVNPTVLADMTIFPSAATVVVTGVNPTVLSDITLFPVAAPVVVIGVNPLVHATVDPDTIEAVGRHRRRRP